MNRCSPAMPKLTMVKTQMYITVNPSEPEAPPPPPESPIPEKLRKIMEKYKYNWRIEALSKPQERSKRVKFVLRKKAPVAKPEIKLSDETQYYADQMSRAPLRLLVQNKKDYKSKGRRYIRTLNKSIKKSWASIYNFYKKKERDKKIRQKRQQEREKKSKPIDDKKAKEKEKESQEWFNKMATPKKAYPPDPPPPRKYKPLEELTERDAEMAVPKQFVLTKPKSLEVNPAALTYEATENIIKMAQPPERYKLIQKPLIPGHVSRAALRYKITPRIEEIALPKKRTAAVAVADDNWDPFAVSENAKKYKATPRILELAKPSERT